MIVNGLSQCPSSTTAFTFDPNAPVQLTWLNIDSTTMSISGKAVFTVSAERVALLYRSSDVTAPGASSTAGSDSSGASSGSSSSGPSGSASGSGLSTGAVAGIAIGAAAVGIVAVLAFFWLCLRRRSGSFQGRAEWNKAGDAHPPPAVAHPSSLAPTGAVHELKATNTVSTRQAPAGHAASNATELQGSTAFEPQWAALPPQHGVAGVNPIYGGEVSTSNNYHQLSGTFERGQGPLDNSRQSTPVDLVGRGAGGRGFSLEKVSRW